MTNLDALKKFDKEVHGAKIEKLFWIASNSESSDLKEFIENMEEQYFERCFPDIYKSQYFNQYLDNDDLIQSLFDFKKFGLLAEIYIPTCDNFRFKNGEPVSWSVHEGVCRIEYVYAETLQDLMNSIESVSETVFNEFVTKYKKVSNANN